MSLQSLVVCSDEKIVRVLRRVLSDLEIAVEHCSQADAAIHKLTRQRFEAVIVDCAEARGASQVLRSARAAPCNKRAIAVAILDEKTGLQNAFAMGAHFVLYKPISMERAKTSFRAARALMKRERRRNVRLPLEIPVSVRMSDGPPQKTVTLDISEGGIAVKLGKRSKQVVPTRVEFALPGQTPAIECDAEVAWENASGSTGIRFVHLSPECQHTLMSWLNRQAPEAERDDPPVSCKLTDLSVGGCYLQVVSPFPMRTRVVLSMRIADLEMQAEGVVRVMHPEVGMGVEFLRKNAEQTDGLEKFIQALMNGNGALPELLVEPVGLETDSEPGASVDDPVEDPLLNLFRYKTGLPAEAFLAELQRQRQPDAAVPDDVLSL